MKEKRIFAVGAVKSALKSQLKQVNMMHKSLIFCLLLSTYSCATAQNTKVITKQPTPTTVPKAEPTTEKKPEMDPTVTERWEPIPAKVTPARKLGAPSDAIVLLDGTSSDQFTHKDGSRVQWSAAEGALTVKPGAGDIMSKQKFGSMQLHLEWRAPAVVKGEGQGRGNSGVFLQSRYEVQILDSYESRTYSNGQATAVYKQHIPLVNACLPNTEWNVYDIIYHAPIFNTAGMMTTPPTITVIHNGILVQDNVSLLGTTEYRGLPQIQAHGDDAIILQDHGDLVSFRNIWVRKL
jgi:Domain of Unknown Function (DUF1080)